MIETKISKAIINELRQLQVSFIVKEGDYTLAELELLRGAKNNGDLLDLDIAGLVNGDKNKEHSKNLQILSLVIKDYCEEFNLKEDLEIGNIYCTYNVSSRKELKNEDVISLIEMYRTSLKTGLI